MKYLILVFFALIICQPVFAKPESKQEAKECPVVKTASLEVKIKAYKEKAEDALDVVDLRVAKAEEIARSLQIEKIDVRDSSYSVSSRSYPREGRDPLIWEINGRFIVRTESIDKAKKFMIELLKNDFDVDMSVRTSRPSNC